MKIVCDSCSAKYSIADEKVAGKIFKIRCKRCGAILTVRGDQQMGNVEDDPATRVYDHGTDTAIWHVVMNGDQQGPFTPQQVGELLSGQQIDWETYVWRDGFADWVPARDASDLVQAITGTADAADAAADHAGYVTEGHAAEEHAADGADGYAAEGYPAESYTAESYTAESYAAAGQSADADASGAYAADTEGAGFQAPAYDTPAYDKPAQAQAFSPFAEGDAGSDPFGSDAQDIDPFAGGDAPHASVPGHFGSPPEHSRQQDPFAQPYQAMGFGGGTAQSDAVVASAPSPRVSAEQAMTGARNENSVLFSLKNLQALATGSNTASSNHVAVSSAGPATGFASGEGSGLIDIRALAQATGLNKATNGQGDHDKVDDLLSMGGGSAAFGSLASPMLTPSMPAEGGSQKQIVFAVLGGFSILAVAVVGTLFALKDDRAVEPAVAVAAGEGLAATKPADDGASDVVAAAKATKVSEPAPSGTPDKDESAAAAAGAAVQKDEKPTPTPAAKPQPQRRATRSTRGRSARSAPVAAAASKPTPVAEQKRSTPAPKPSGGSSSIDDLLDGALSGKSSPRPAAAPAPAPSNLPQSPSRDDVMNSMNKVKSAVSACGKGQSGIAMTAVTVAGSTGRVTNAKVSGDFAGTPVAACVERVVGKVQFPRFQQSTFTVNFPYKI